MKRLFAQPRVLTSMAVAVFALIVAIGIYNRAPEVQYLMLALLAMTTLGGLATASILVPLVTLVATLGLYGLVLVTSGASLLSLEAGLGAGMLVVSAAVASLLSHALYAIEHATTRQTALVDALTIYDRETGAIRTGHMIELLNYEVARARRYDEALTVAAVQLREPPKGPAARELQRKLSTLFLAKLRTVDRVGYLGDTGCLLILPNTTQHNADIVAGRLVHLAYEQLAVNIVIGLATFPEDGAGTEDLLHEAGAALEFGRMNALPVVSPQLFGLEQVV